MNKTNFHTHNYRCEHARGTVDDYVQKAIENGYTELGISDHAPVPKYYTKNRMKMEDFEGYLKEIEDAKQKNKDKIKIYKSVEIEYFPEFSSYYRELQTKLDYLVLGLHAYRYKDEEEHFSTSWNINNEKDVEAYGKYMVEAIESGFFDYIAHPDLYMSNYREWNQVTERVAHYICRAAKIADIPLEVNANGIRKTLAEHPDWDRYQYPYREFWEIAKQYDVKVIIGSDAHDFETMEDVAMSLARLFAEDLELNVIETIF